MKPPFPQWFLDLSTLAERQDLLAFIGSAESHLEGFEDGLTPAEELAEQIDAAR